MDTVLQDYNDFIDEMFVMMHSINKEYFDKIQEYCSKDHFHWLVVLAINTPVGVDRQNLLLLCMVYSPVFYKENRFIPPTYLRITELRESLFRINQLLVDPDLVIEPIDGIIQDTTMRDQLSDELRQLIFSK